LFSSHLRGESGTTNQSIETFITLISFYTRIKIMKNILATKFILLTFIFSWLCWSIAIFNGQPNTAFPNIIFFTLGGSMPTLIALIFVLCTFDKDKRRDFWSRVINPGRIRRAWWLIPLVITFIFVLGITLDVFLSGVLSAMPNLKALVTDPVSIPSSL